MAQTSWQDYVKLLQGLAKTLGQLAEIEREKNAAASSGDLAKVEDCMKREQAMSLSLRGYDQKRSRPRRRSCAGSMRSSRQPVRRPAPRWRSTCGPSNGPRPSRPATPPRQRRSANNTRPTSGPEARGRYQGG